MFKIKRHFTPDEYYLNLAQESILLGLITEREFKDYTKSFIQLRLSPLKTVHALETIVKLRQDNLDAERRNKVQSEDKFMDEIIKHKPRKKKK